MSKNIIIYSTIKLYQGNSAGSSRVTKYSKALAEKNKIYLITFLDNGDICFDKIKEVEKNIFVHIPNKKHFNRIIRKVIYPFEIIRFVKKIASFTEKLENETVFLLYPSTKIFIDFISIIYLLYLKKKKVFLEVGEVRRFAVNLKDSTFVTSPTKYVGNKLLLLKYIISERFSKYFKGLICISTNIKEYFLKYNKNIILVPILSDKILIRDYPNKTYSKAETFLICFSGQIIISKENLDLFLESLHTLSKDFQQFEFHLYGPAEKSELQKLNALSKKYNLDKYVFYKGFVEQSRLQSIYEKYHLLVSPRGNTYQNKYGFSTKLAEFLASGVPVMMTDVSDNCLYIQDGYNGFVVQPDNTKAMAEKMNYIRKNYNPISNTISINAYDTVQKFFSYENYSEILNEFLV